MIKLNISITKYHMFSSSLRIYFFRTFTAFSPSSSRRTASNGFKSYVLTTKSAEMFFTDSTFLSFRITPAQSSPQPVIVTIFASSKIGEQALGCAEYSVMHAATIFSFSNANSTLAALTTRPNGLKPLQDTKAILSLIFSSFLHTFF